MAAEEHSSLIDVSNINEKVYSYIKACIMNFTYPPGFNLNLNQLSEKLGVSHTPIKDALFKLAGEGLVEIAPRKGTYVKDVTQDDIREILQTRLILEAAAVDAVTARLSDDQLSQFAQIYERMISIEIRENDVESYRAFIECDSEFHLLFFRILGNQRLLTMVKNLNANMQIGRFRLFHRRGKNPTTDQEHADILKALQDRDTGRAKEAVQRHLLSLIAACTLQPGEAAANGLTGSGVQGA
jgi:DNA-binding GntR family transcriptional regulator